MSAQPLQFPAPPPLGLYVHLPWCVRKCPYCDFNSHALRATLPEQAYVDALLRDLDEEVACADGRPVETIFIGGGTPSLFSAAGIDRLLRGVRARLNLPPTAEITLEANPGASEQDRFVGYREAGVNRLSIGVQSFDDAHLGGLGRIHGRAEALHAAAAAREAGFRNVNLDLMYGLPEQDVEGALADLRQAVALSPGHISHYQLTLEPNTLFHAQPPRLPDDDVVCEMQQASQALLADAGFRRYEVSAYAPAGSEARHNLNYWTFGDYLAVGAGAHGKLTDVRTGTIRRYSKLKHPRDYQAGAGGQGVIAEQHTLRPDDVVLEFMMNALRLPAGFSIALYEARTGLPWAGIGAVADAAEQMGWLETRDTVVRPTERGLLYLNELLQLFMPLPA